jgi:hypothetical protein
MFALLGKDGIVGQLVDYHIRLGKQSRFKDSRHVFVGLGNCEFHEKYTVLQTQSENMGVANKIISIGE